MADRGDAQAKRAVDLARFREMVGRQTEELNAAIQQRTDYEGRLQAAEHAMAQLQEENDALRAEARQSTEAARTNAVSPLFELSAAEAAHRLEIVDEQNYVLLDTIFRTYVDACVSLKCDEAVKEEKARSSALTFQLRVATPLRIRTLLAKVAVLERREASAQQALEEANQQVEMLLLDSSELREQKVFLEEKVAAIEQDTRAVDTLRDQIDASREEHEELLRQLEASASEVNMLHAENEALRQRLHHAAEEVRQIADRESKIKEDASQWQKASEDIGQSKSELAQGHAADLALLERRLASLRDSQRLTDVELRKAQTKEQGLMSELDALEQQVTRLKHEKSELVLQLQDERTGRENDLTQLHDAFEQRSASTMGELRALRMAVGSADVSSNTLRYQTETLRQQLEDALKQQTDTVNSFLVEKKQMEDRQLAMMQDHTEALKQLQTQYSQSATAREQMWENKFATVAEEAEARIRVVMASRQDLVVATMQNEGMVLSEVKERHALLRNAETRHRQELAAVEQAFDAERRQSAKAFADTSRALKEAKEELHQQAAEIANRVAGDEEKSAQVSALEKDLRAERLNSRRLAAETDEQRGLIASLEALLASANKKADAAADTVRSLEVSMQHAKEASQSVEAGHRDEVQALLDSEMSLRRQRTQLQSDVQRVTDELARVASLELAGRKEIDVLKGTIDAAMADVEHLRKSLEECQQSRRELERANLRLDAQVKDLQQVGDASRDVLSDAHGAKAQLTEELLQLRETCTVQEKQLAVVRQELERHKLSLTQTSEELHERTHELQTTQAQRIKLQEACDAHQQTLEACAAENETLRAIMDDSVDAVETEVRALHVEAGSLKNEKERLDACLKLKQSEVRRLEDYIASLQTDGVSAETHWKERYHAMDNQCVALRYQVQSIEEQLLQQAQQHIEDHRQWALQAEAERKEVAEEVKAERDAAAAAKKRSIVLENELSDRTEALEARDQRVAALLNDLTMLEAASVEALDEQRQLLDAAKAESMLQWERLERSAESIAQLTVRLDVMAKERDAAAQQYDVTKVTLAEVQRQNALEMQALRDAHAREALEVESMSEKMVSQERHARQVLAEHAEALQAAVRKGQERERVLEDRAEDAEGLVRRLTVKFSASTADVDALKESSAETEGRLREHVRALERDVIAHQTTIHRLEDALELEKSSSVAEEHALREEIQRREEQHAKKLNDLSEEHRAELARHGVTSEHVTRARNTEVEALQAAVQTLEKQLRCAVDQHSELYEKLSNSERMVDEVSHKHGAVVMDCERLTRMLQAKSEDLEVVFAQANTATNATSAAEKKLLESEGNAMELRKALVATQTALEVAQRNEAAAVGSVANIEAAVEHRWRQQASLERDAWTRRLQAEQLAMVVTLEHLETRERDTIVQMYDGLHLNATLGRLALSWRHSSDDWISAEARLTVELSQATARLKAKSSAAATAERALAIELESERTRSRTVFSMMLAHQSTVLAFSLEVARGNAGIQRESRTHQARLVVQDQNLTRLRSEVADQAAALHAVRLELDEAKRNGDSLARMSSDVSAEAAEYESKYRSMLTERQRMRGVCDDALAFAMQNLLTDEAVFRRAILGLALEQLSDVGHAFTQLFINCCSENVQMQRLQARSESVLRSEVDQLHATWRDRLDSTVERAQELQLKANVTQFLSDEARQRAAILQAHAMWSSADLFPLHQSSLVMCLRAQHHKEVKDLRHALYVGHKESILIKQRAQTLVDLEVASCKQSIERLQRRRMEDLRWLPNSSVLLPGTPFDGGKTPGQSASLYTVDDLETKARSIIVRMAMDSIHALHMCLLIS